MPSLADFLISISRYGKRSRQPVGRRILAATLSAMLALGTVSPAAALAGEAESEEGRHGAAWGDRRRPRRWRRNRSLENPRDRWQAEAAKRIRRRPARGSRTGTRIRTAGAPGRRRSQRRSDGSAARSHPASHFRSAERDGIRPRIRTRACAARLGSGRKPAAERSSKHRQRIRSAPGTEGREGLIGAFALAGTRWAEEKPAAATGNLGRTAGPTPASRARDSTPCNPGSAYDRCRALLPAGAGNGEVAAEVQRLSPARRESHRDRRSQPAHGRHQAPASLRRVGVAPACAAKAGPGGGAASEKSCKDGALEEVGLPREVAKPCASVRECPPERWPA